MPIENPQTAPVNPFSADDRARAEEALRLLYPIKDLISRCERCGIPCSAMADDCKACEAWFQKVLGEFFGGNSPMPSM